MRVDSKNPCKIVYSLCRHDYLGHLIEPHIVQLNAQGDFLLTHQRLFSTTASEFAAFLDETDLALIKILDTCEQEYLIRNYLSKPVRPSVFFANYHENPTLHAQFRRHLDVRLDQCLLKLSHKQLFEMGKDGNCTWRPLQIADEPARILFHFRKNALGTRYFPTIKYKDQRIEFMFKEASIITNTPAWMLLEQTLYLFEPKLDGKKLLPFLNKRFIEVPKSSEPAYFKKFVLPLVEKYPVYAEGFDILTQKHQAVALIKLNMPAYGADFLALNFRYGPHEFSNAQASAVSVFLEHQNDNYTFLRVKRARAWELEKVEALKTMGLHSLDSVFFSFRQKHLTGEKTRMPNNMLEWINFNFSSLEKEGFVIEQVQNGKKHFLGELKISLQINESSDWFDINAVVEFGPYKIPFIALREHILHRNREFSLPGGEIALIPELWFSEYGSLFDLSEPGNELRLRKHHLGLVREFEENSLARVQMSSKLRALTNFDKIEESPCPKGIKGELRPYQQAGFNWFCFLQKFRFGGCLADDMGLGKTLQTITLLQHVKEDAGEPKPSSLIVMPTSLIHNWVSEIAKFAPDLQVLVYTGSERQKEASGFSRYDVVLTTYGIVRLDETIFRSYSFHYLILDESQHIKNPQSKISRAVKGLKSAYRLILSGTPMENSITDLWSQMSFVNPGLLGGYSFFTEHFCIPIEKKADTQRLQKLQNLIKPFILRRTKQQVASELPPKTEQLFYSDMSEEQEVFYEKTKAYYRDLLLKIVPGEGWRKNKFSMLQGLTRLRQIANHPGMVDPEYVGDSGKFNDVRELLGNTLSEGHKVLVFSSFTKHLALFRKQLDEDQIPYSYLDGSSKKRSEIVSEFQNDKTIQLFLISIKAGGTGLNLTEADYVFILDPWWNPAVERQAIDRTHRIGQTKNVFIYKFITKNSVEEKILALQNRKKDLTDSLIQLEESFMKQLSLQDILSILE